MTSDFIPFASPLYFLMLSLLLFSRGMDFLSTWVATPSLALEGNPLAKKLGWKLGAVVNIVLCIAFALWPLTAIIVITSGLLVAGHNFHAAWLMRTMGEDEYRRWFVERLAHTPLPFYFACLLGETAMIALVGIGLLCFSNVEKVPFAIGLGIIMYAVIILFYTTLALVRMRRRFAAEAVAAAHQPPERIDA
jgi:hypothetical protein